MEVRYLETAELSVRWFRLYYRQKPQHNVEKAFAALVRTEAMLREFPEALRQSTNR